MEYSIEINESIRKKRLIYRLNGFALSYYIIVSSFVYVLIIAIFLFVSVVSFSQGEIVFACLVMLFVAWMIANFILVNKLTKISGCGINENRALIIKVLNVYYSDLKLQDSGQMLVRDIKYSGPVSSGRCITIIFNSNDFYINIQTLRWDEPSPFHGLFHYLKCQDIKKQFSKL